MARQPAIAVTGSTGELGGRVARRLATTGVPQKLIVRNRERAPSITGASVMQASYEDPDAMRGALAGASTLFLVSAKESLERVAQHQTAVDAAVAAGVQRIVYTSFLSAGPEATFSFARDHFRTEQHIRQAGIEYTFLRPALYADRVPYFVAEDGVLRGPAAEGRSAWVTRDDLADVSAAVLTRGNHDGCTYDVTGPEALTMAETAARLEKVIGRSIAYEQETLEGARASRAGSGADWEIEGWITSYAAMASGEMAVLSDNVAKLAGHAPQSLASYLRTHAESYQHLLTGRYIQH